MRVASCRSGAVRSRTTRFSVMSDMRFLSAVRSGGVRGTGYGAGAGPARLRREPAGRDTSSGEVMGRVSLDRLVRRTEPAHVDHLGQLAPRPAGGGALRGGSRLGGPAQRDDADDAPVVGD